MRCVSLGKSLPLGRGLPLPCGIHEMIIPARLPRSAVSRSKPHGLSVSSAAETSCHTRSSDLQKNHNRVTLALLISY